MLQADHLPGRTVTLEGREYLYCSGTSYLGIPRNEQFTALLAEGLRHYGTNYSSSRISNLQLRVFEEAENYLARWTGAQAALTVSSGYLAGQLAVQVLHPESRLAYAPGTHPAVTLPVGHCFETREGETYEGWVERLLEELARHPEENWVIVTNSLDPLLVRRYDFAWVSRLPVCRSLTLLVDDSHGLGVIGREGAGIFTELTVPAHVQVAVVGSLGKALGIPGGVVLGEQTFIDRLRRSSFFGGSSPAIPAYLYALLRAGELYREARIRLSEHIGQFLQGVEALNLFRSIAHYPVFYTSRHQLCEFLKERDVLISSFPYPTPQDPLITRIVLNSGHTADDIRRLTDLIRTFSTTLT